MTTYTRVCICGSVCGLIWGLKFNLLSLTHPLTYTHTYTHTRTHARVPCLSVTVSLSLSVSRTRATERNYVLIPPPAPEEHANKKHYERNEYQQKQGIVRLSNSGFPQETLEVIVGVRAVWMRPAGPVFGRPPNWTRHDKVQLPETK